MSRTIFKIFLILMIFGSLCKIVLAFVGKMISTFLVRFG